MDNTAEKKKKSSKYAYLGLIAGLLIVVALGYYIYKDESGRTSTQGGVSDDLASTTTITINGVTMEVPKGSKVAVEQVGESESVNAGPAPSLSRPINYPTDFPVEAQTLFKMKLADTKSEIGKDPYSYEAWIYLGQLRQMIQDYEGARLAWEYAAKISPARYVAFGNLGFLYGYYLKEPVKAEAAFLKALANGPTQLYLYQQTFEFYRDVMKDNVKALDLANKGERATSDKAYFDKLRSTL